jgi:hypothetical protein
MQKLFTIRNLIIIGLILRLGFMFIGAPLYYGTSDYATNGGDTWSWADSMTNLVHTGTYTCDPSYEDGKFYRPPGFAFFLMIFYLISGCHLPLAFKLAVFAQILLDTISIFLVYGIVKNNKGSEKLALGAALLYTIYPFVIVWAPVLYAETSSIFFMLWGIYLLSITPTRTSLLLAGFAIGAAILTRLQIFFIIPGLLYFIYLRSKSVKGFFTSPFIWFFISFGITYGSWPIRNLMHGQFIPDQKLENNAHFSRDYIAFMNYIWSVKTDHRPQYDHIIHGEPVVWPKASYLHPGDSATLARIAVQCSTCSRGFSHFMYTVGLAKERIKDYNACSQEITETFNRLREEQIKENFFHFAIIVPLSNLKKCIFKSALYDAKSNLVKIVSTILFSYRTLFIILGIIGLWLNRKQKMISKELSGLILIYNISWIFMLCFVYRNIEIRYLLMTDILLLLPAMITIQVLFKTTNKKPV